MTTPTAAPCASNATDGTEILARAEAAEARVRQVADLAALLAMYGTRQPNLCAAHVVALLFPLPEDEAA